MPERQPRSLTEPVLRAQTALEGLGHPTGRNFEEELIRAQERLRLSITKLRTLVGRTTRIEGHPVSVIELPDDSPIGKKLAVVVELPRPQSRLRDHGAADDEGPRYRRLLEISDTTRLGRRDHVRVSTEGYVGKETLHHEPNPPILVIDAIAGFSNDLVARMTETSEVPTDEANRAQQAWLRELRAPRYEDTHPDNGGAL